MISSTIVVHQFVLNTSQEVIHLKQITSGKMIETYFQGWASVRQISELFGDDHPLKFVRIADESGNGYCQIFCGKVPKFDRFGKFENVEIHRLFWLEFATILSIGIGVKSIERRSKETKLGYRLWTGKSGFTATMNYQLWFPHYKWTTYINLLNNF
jgi:hypothetical protein